MGCKGPRPSAPFVEETIFSPLNGLSGLVQNQLPVGARVYFWTLSPTADLSVDATPAPSSPDCRGFVFEIRTSEFSNFALFQDCFRNTVCLEFPRAF